MNTSPYEELRKRLDKMEEYNTMLQDTLILITRAAKDFGFMAAVEALKKNEWERKVEYDGSDFLILQKAQILKDHKA